MPNAGARALALQRTGTLGALIPTLNNAIFAEGINAFEQAARELGYSLILAVSEPSQSDHVAQVLRMIERGVDGLLLIGNHHDSSAFERLEKTSVKVACAWSYEKNSRAANIGFDNAIAMHPVVDHLLQLGHEHIGMLAGVSEHNDRARERIRGARERLEKHGRELPDNYVVEVPYNINAARKAFWQLIDNDLSAVICGNDVIAYGACFEAISMGLRIPQDLSITGFDNLQLSGEITPALTTVNVEARSMGEQAARELIRAIEQHDEVGSIELSTSLLVRDTTGSLSEY